MDGFEKAGSLWASQITDTYLDSKTFGNLDTEINIFVNYSQLSTDNVLGGARPGMVRVDYDKYLTASFRNITSEADWQAFRSLQMLSNDGGITKGILAELGVNQYNTDAQNRSLLASLGLNLDRNIEISNQGTTILNQLTLDHLRQINRNNVDFKSDQFNMLATANSTVSYDKIGPSASPNQNTLIDNNGNDNNQRIWLTRANAKALGLLPGNDNAFDAEIAINSVILGQSALESTWDFSRVYNDAAGVHAEKYDFLSVAQHEIGHALGFVSGLDAFELLSATAAGASNILIADKDLAYVSPMDLYRYSEESRAVGMFDWSVSTGDRFFSIDGGQTRIASFATGISAEGDGYQSSHWNQQDDPLGVMTPALRRGQALSISENDLLFLDVLGWERAGNAVFADMSGINVGMEAVGNSLSARVEQTGLDWKTLETILTKPAQALLSDLAQERTAMLVHRRAELEGELTVTKNELTAEQNALKLLQSQTELAIRTKEGEVKNQLGVVEGQQKALGNLQKAQADFQKEIQSLETKLQEQQAKLRTTTKESDRQKIQAEISKLESSISQFNNQLQSNQTQQVNLQATIQREQNILNILQADSIRLRTELVNLQTTPRIQALQLTKTNLEATLKTLNSLESEALKLSERASATYIKEALDKIKLSLENKLSNLKNAGDGPRRLAEERKAIEQVMKLAREQEARWNLLITNHETALFPGADSQIQQWLAGTPASLKAHMETATLYQLELLYETVANASEEQQIQWMEKLSQASFLLANAQTLSARDAAKLQSDIAKRLEDLLESSSQDSLLSRSRTSQRNGSLRYWLSRSRSSSMNTSLRYWQAIHPSYMSTNEYSENGAFIEGVEQATLNQMLFSTAYPTSTSSASVPEPTATFGLLGMGLFGLGSLRRRRKQMSSH